MAKNKIIDIGDTSMHSGAIRYGAMVQMVCQCQLERHAQEAISGQYSPLYVRPVSLGHIKCSMQRQCAPRAKYRLEVYIFQGRCANCGRIYQGWHHIEWYTKAANYRPGDFAKCQCCLQDVPTGTEFAAHINAHVDRGDTEKYTGWQLDWLLDNYNFTKD